MPTRTLFISPTDRNINEQFWWMKYFEDLCLKCLLTKSSPGAAQRAAIGCSEGLEYFYVISKSMSRKLDVFALK